MYRLVKWAHDLGKRHAYEQLRAELYLFIGQEPVRFRDPEFEMEESEKNFQKRIDAWFEARKMLQAFFNDRDNRRPEDEL